MLEPPTAPRGDVAAPQPPAGAHLVVLRAGGAAASGWPSKEEVESLKNVQDESELSRLIAHLTPGVTREEVLFRYNLSRAVFFGEHELPALPQSAARVLQLSRNANAGAVDYARVVEADPGLVKPVLRLANSSFYGALAACSSLTQAMVRVGVREVERIALLQALQARVFRVHGHDELVHAVERHGLTVALAAQAVARRTGASPADAFLAGLFHDVGKLVVLNVIAEVQRRLKRTAPATLVQAAFDAFHVVVGECALKHWGLPEDIVRGATSHHDPALAAQQALDRATYLGNCLAHRLEGAPPPASGGEDPVIAAAGLSAEDLTSLAEQLAAEVTEYERILA